MSIISVDENTFFNEIDSGLHVVAEFGTDRCVPSKMQIPILENLARESKVKVIKIDIDDNPKLTNQFKIFSVPTIIVFKDGKEFIRKTGLTNLEELKKYI